MGVNGVSLDAVCLLWAGYVMDDLNPCTTTDGRFGGVFVGQYCLRVLMYFPLYRVSVSHVLCLHRNERGNGVSLNEYS